MSRNCVQNFSKNKSQTYFEQAVLWTEVSNESPPTTSH